MLPLCFLFYCFCHNIKFNVNPPVPENWSKIILYLYKRKSPHNHLASSISGRVAACHRNRYPATIPCSGCWLQQHPLDLIKTASRHTASQSLQPPAAKSLPPFRENWLLLIPGPADTGFLRDFFGNASILLRYRFAVSRSRPKERQ